MYEGMPLSAFLLCSALHFSLFYFPSLSREHYNLTKYVFVAKIYYASRTHSQLAQIRSEASRLQICLVSLYYLSHFSFRSHHILSLPGLFAFTPLLPPSYTCSFSRPPTPPLAQSLSPPVRIFASMTLSAHGVQPLPIWMRGVERCSMVSEPPFM